MASKQLYYHRIDDEHSFSYYLEDGQIVEKEKIGGRYKPIRVISATEAGYGIAARRYLDKRDFEWRIPGELPSALNERIQGKAPVYWGTLLTQGIHKIKEPRHEIVDYEAVRASSDSLPVAAE